MPPRADRQPRGARGSAGVARASGRCNEIPLAAVAAATSAIAQSVPSASATTPTMRPPATKPHRARSGRRRRLRAVARLDGVGDGGDQRRVDHRGAGAEQDRGERARGRSAPPPATRSASAPAWTSIPSTISGLRPMWSESQPVRELADAPDGRVDGGDDADLGGARAVGGEVERRETPGERVVEVVDEPCLRAGAQHGIAVVSRGERCARS